MVEDIVIARTEGRELDGIFGRGMAVVDGAQTTIRRALILENRDVGLLTSTDASLEVEDLVIRGTRAEAFDQSGGRGLSVVAGGRATVTRALIDGNREVGAFVNDPTSELTLLDAVVRDTREDASDEEAGFGLLVQLGARLVARRVVVERNQEAGVFISNTDTEATLEDVVVRDTLPTASDMRDGRGIVVQQRARLEVRRAIVERNRAVSVFLATSAQGTIEDLVVRDTLPEVANGAFGRALNVQEVARAEVHRALLERSRVHGVFVGVADLDLDDVVIRDIDGPDCAPGCPAQGVGVGVGSYGGSNVRLRRFQVATASVCGVQVDGLGSLRLEDGEVSRHPIGACIQVDDYPLATLRQQVEFVDNEVNVERTDLPLGFELELLDQLED